VKTLGRQGARRLRTDEYSPLLDRHPASYDVPVGACQLVEVVDSRLVVVVVVDVVSGCRAVVCVPRLAARSVRTCTATCRSVRHVPTSGRSDQVMGTLGVPTRSFRCATSVLRHGGRTLGGTQGRLGESGSPWGRGEGTVGLAARRASCSSLSSVRPFGNGGPWSSTTCARPQRVNFEPGRVARQRRPRRLQLFLRRATNVAPWP